MSPGRCAKRTPRKLLRPLRSLRLSLRPPLSFFFVIFVRFVVNRFSVAAVHDPGLQILVRAINLTL